MTPNESLPMAFQTVEDGLVVFQVDPTLDHNDIVHGWQVVTGMAKAVAHEALDAITLYRFTNTFFCDGQAESSGFARVRLRQYRKAVIVRFVRLALENAAILARLDQAVLSRKVIRVFQ